MQKSIQYSNAAREHFTLFFIPFHKLKQKCEENKRCQALCYPRRLMLYTIAKLYTSTTRFAAYLGHHRNRSSTELFIYYSLLLVKIQNKNFFKFNADLMTLKTGTGITVYQTLFKKNYHNEDHYVVKNKRTCKIEKDSCVSPL